jgi:hypothetical protein
MFANAYMGRESWAQPYNRFLPFHSQTIWKQLYRTRLPYLFAPRPFFKSSPNRIASAISCMDILRWRLSFCIVR